MEIQARAKTLGNAAKSIVRQLGKYEAFSAEIDNGHTIRQARAAMLANPDAWLLANGWMVEYPTVYF
jgi:hypothetical protein